MQRVCVVGGGPAGLAFAFFLRRMAPAVSVDVLEASASCGGWLSTAEVDGFLFERGCRGIRANSANGKVALQLLSSLGLTKHALPAAPEANRRYIWDGSALSKVPSSLVEVAQWPLLGSWAKLVQALTLRHAAPEGDESVHSFVSRHCGEAVADNIVDAVLSGVYAGDTRQLSAAAVLPFLVDAVKAGGGSTALGLLRSSTSSMPPPPVGAWHPADPLLPSLTRASSVNLLRGMGSLPSALVDALQSDPGANVHTSVPVTAVNKEDGGVLSVNGPNRRMGSYTSVVLAAPANATASILQQSPGGCAAGKVLAKTPFASVSTVCFGWRHVSHAAVLGGKSGFGYLVPSAHRGAAPGVLGAVFDSCTFPTQAAGGGQGVRVSVMMGGASMPEVAQWSEEAKADAARAALVNHLHGGRQGALPPPDVTAFHGGDNCIPQYTVGHRDRVADARAQLAAGMGGHVHLLGNSYDGVGIADVVAQSQALAERVAADLKAAR